MQSSIQGNNPPLLLAQAVESADFVHVKQFVTANVADDAGGGKPDPPERITIADTVEVDKPRQPAVFDHHILDGNVVQETRWSHRTQVRLAPANDLVNPRVPSPERIGVGRVFGLVVKENVPPVCLWPLLTNADISKTVASRQRADCPLKPNELLRERRHLYGTHGGELAQQVAAG